MECYGIQSHWWLFTIELVLFLGIVLSSFFYYLCFVLRIALLKPENTVFILSILNHSFGRMFALFKRVWVLVLFFSDTLMVVEEA